MSELTHAPIRVLKARAQLLKPLLKVGHDGLSPAFIRALDAALAQHELVKVKFSDFKDQTKALTPQLAEQTRSRVVLHVGHVAVLFRARPAAEKTE